VVYLAMRGEAEFGALGLALGGAMLWYPLGVAGGLFVLKRAFKIPGSIVLGAVGAIVGAAVVLGLATLLNRTGDPSISIVAYFVLVPALATVGLRIGDNKRRPPGKKKPPSKADG
jgi:phosphate/sulfate permease